MTKKTSKSKKLTPMMKQYLDVRKTLPPNTLLLFRLGDFYEMFDQDAVEGSQILGITLTNRNGQQMAGIPYHAADNYIQKALNHGRKVAICEQMETPVPGKIVKRELTRILTPGTALEDHQLNAGKSNYILALDSLEGRKQKEPLLLCSWMDVSTGEFKIAADHKVENLLPVLNALDPAELIIPESGSDEWGNEGAESYWDSQIQLFISNRAHSTVPDYHFDLKDGLRTVLESLRVRNLDGFGIDNKHPALGAAGALIQYVSDNLCSRLNNLRKLQEYKAGKTLLLDPATLRNLEIFQSSAHTREGSLLTAMNKTVTAPGARLLEQFLIAPVLDLDEIRRRQSCVGSFLDSPGFASELQEYLRFVRDLPRILGRLKNHLRNPRELGAIRDTLHQLPFIRQVLEQFEGSVLEGYLERIVDYPELFSLLQSALADELPNHLNDGNYIRDAYDEELDYLRSLTRNSKDWIASFEATEQERTGIKKLRVKSNNAFGYFIEVTKSNLSLVPDDYIRRQTTVNAERYYTTELKEKEREILSADEKSLAREEVLFKELVAAVLEQADQLEDTALALAELDVFLGWSQLAREWDYCCPVVDESTQLSIEEGRHPVVEQMLQKDPTLQSVNERGFVPNDTMLSSDEEQIAIITGPNMAGKSTYIRQVALIVLMAQVGSWVPAKSCHVGCVDRIFSRVGASDELSRGNSTFMVEMNETANILNNASERSLIILDEIGRGTSTYDGLSIAWAVVEYLHGEVRLDPESPVNTTQTFHDSGPRTLFATHYHELTQIEGQLKRVRNYSVAVKEWNDEIIFVRQVIAGAADRSYGIQVARLAGIPDPVISRAKRILERLEADDSSHNLLRQRMRRIKESKAAGKDDLDLQLELF